jgi:hypothetical protein
VSLVLTVGVARVMVVGISAEAARREPTAMTQQKFEEDVIICSDDGTIFHLTPEQLAPFEVTAEQQETEKYEFIRNMLQSGVSCAAIPPSVNSADSQSMVIPTCYVLNLASFKKHTVYED